MSWKTLVSLEVSHLTGDADSGVSSAFSYTCAVNAYGSQDKVVNGVTFKAETGTHGAGWQIIQNFSSGHSGQNSSVNGKIGEVLDNRMRYNGSPGKILLSGLTPGKPYALCLLQPGLGKQQVGHLVLLRPSGNRHRRPKSIQLIQPGRSIGGVPPRRRFH